MNNKILESLSWKNKKLKAIEELIDSFINQNSNQDMINEN